MSAGLYPGKRLRDGRYRLLSKLRAGATAQVWRALDARDGVEVAIKAVPTDAGGADAVEHEAEAVARVQHPGAVRVLATFEEADHGLIVMELAAGSLADRVDAHGPLDGAATRAIGLALAEVLAAAHAAGVVHRDVKPQNVLVMTDGSVRLADFGIARVHARGHTRTGALLGTLPFMAPEQRRDARDVRPATDIYALAALIAWMRTGVMPGDLFVPEVIAALRARLLAAGEPDDALLDVIVAAGRYAPAERIADGARMAEALRGVGVGVGMAAAAVSVAGSAAARMRRLGWGAGLVGVLAVAGVGLITVRGAVGDAAGAGGRVAKGDAVTSASTTTFPACPDAVSEWVEDVRMGPRETTAATLADVDGDGNLDGLFTNQVDESVSIWWGRSGAMPEPKRQDVPTGRAGWSVAVGDVDQDGHGDIVAGLQDDSAFAIVRGLGARRFALPERVFQSPPPRQVALLDENGDGHLDIAFNEGTRLDVRRWEPTNWSPHAALTMGGGSGMLLLGTSLEAGRPSLLLATATGPRQQDVSGRLVQMPGGIEWLLNADRRGNGIFGRATTGEIVRVSATETSCALGPKSPGWTIEAIGDLDGDGTMDAVAHDSCRECTSNHVFLRGVAAPR